MSLSLKSIVAICFMLPMLAMGCNKPQEKPEVTKTEEPKEQKQKSPETKSPATTQKSEPATKEPAPKSADPDSGSKSQSDGKAGGKSDSGNAGGTSGDNPGGAPGSSGETAPSGGRIPSLADSAAPPRPTVGEALSKGEKELRAAKAAFDKGDKTAAAKHAMLAWEATHDFGGNAECLAVNKQAEALLEKFGAVPSDPDVDLSRVLIR